MMHDVDRLRGSATTSFHIVFARDTLPLLCSRMAQARELARAGQLAAAGRKYQALLVASQVMELAVAVHAVVEYADAVGEPSLVLVRTLETFGNQMTPILEAALTEDPGRIQSALRAQPEAFSAWAQYLERWSTHLRADAHRMEVAKRVWDISIGVIAAFETAGALAEIAATGGPPMAPALAVAGGAGAELSGVAYVELAESIRRLIASGALDAAVVASLSTFQASNGKGPPKPSPKFEPTTNPPQQPPAQLRPRHSVRVMPPTEQYPDGYWVETNEYGQPVNPATGKTPANVTQAQARAQTHVPLPPRSE
jgi:hypothetical protein